MAAAALTALPAALSKTAAAVADTEECQSGVAGDCTSGRDEKAGRRDKNGRIVLIDPEINFLVRIVGAALVASLFSLKI